MILDKLIKRFSGAQAATSPRTKDWMPASNGYGIMYSGSSSSGYPINDYTALTYSPYWAAMQAISQTFAILPRYVMDKSDPSNPRRVLDHPSARMLERQVNPLMSPQRFFQLAMYHALNGNFFAELQFVAGTRQVAAMWPIPRDRACVKYKVGARGGIKKYLQVNLPNDKIVYLPNDNFVHIMGLSWDGLEGYNVLEYAADAIGRGKATERYGSKFFANGGDLQGYVTYEMGLDDQARMHIREDMRIQNEGLDNLHRWKFIPEFLKFNPTSASPQDSQMIDASRFSVEEVARIFRIPSPKIGQFKDNIGNETLGEIDRIFWKDTLHPWVKQFVEEFNIKLFQEEEDQNLTVYFDPRELLRGDNKQQAEVHRTYVMSGVLLRNEVRIELGLPPVEGGDQLLVPGNMVASDKQEAGIERVQDG